MNRPVLHSHRVIRESVEQVYPGEGREMERKRTALVHSILLYELSQAVAYERHERHRPQPFRL